MADTWIQRKDSKDKWITDATFIGEGARERADEALGRKRDLSPQHEFRIAPERQPMTYEQMANNRFREKEGPSSARWIMGD